MKNPNCTRLALALLVHAVTATQTHAQSVYTPYTFTTLAGLPGVYGTNDGIGSAARFFYLQGVKVDTNGNVYVADFYNNTIRKGTPVLQFDTNAGNLSVPNDFFQMRLIGAADSNVVVEASADLAAWTPVQTNTLPPFGLDVSMPLGTDQNQFFRARFAP